MSSTLPIYIIGAGGIVNDAHLPAYQLAGYTVAGIYDIDVARAKATATRFNIPQVFTELSDLINASGATGIFDVAVPGDKLPGILQQLPAGAKVLMQKPMGTDMAQAAEIVSIAHAKSMTAAVNFQLRYAPYITLAHQLINEGMIGELCDVEINVNVYMPWHLWTFLYESPRVEILYHSIHYIDLVRALLGNPEAVFAKTVKHPLMKELASVRSNIIMDYGDMVRANILTNHCHIYGREHQHAYIKLEGTTGAIRIHIGMLMGYPHGEPDVFEYTVLENGQPAGWKTIPVAETWFPHAFKGSMQQVMEAATGVISTPDNSVDDCLYTMACVEAAYQSEGKRSVTLKEIVQSIQQ